MIEGVPDLSGEGVPASQAYPRIVTAVRLHRRLGLPVIVSGGRIRAEDTPEAVIVKRFLVDLGVAESQVILEERSRDTHENAVFTKAVCEREGFRHGPERRRVQAGWPGGYGLSEQLLFPGAPAALAHELSALGQQPRGHFVGSSRISRGVVL